MNNRIDQAIDMGLGAGLMYLFDPDLGKRRRHELLEQAGERVDQAGEAAAQTAQRARETVAQAAHRVGEAALQTSHQTRDAALEAGQQARERALQTANEARDRAASAARQAELQVLGSTTRTGRQARSRLEDVVPAAKTALLGQLVADERVLERARKTLADKELFAARNRRSFAPWGLLLALLGGAAVGAAVMFMLDPGIGRRRRAFVGERVGHVRRQTAETLARAGAQVRDRAGSLGPRQRTAADLPADLMLAERVRAHLNAVSSYPGSIAVTTQDGEVILSGLILSSEIDRVLASVSALPGVQSVANRLEIRRSADQIPGLEGKNNR